MKFLKKSKKKSNKKRLKNVSNKKTITKLSKKIKTFSNKKKKIKKQKGGYDKNKCMASLKELFIRNNINNKNKDKDFDNEVLKKYTDTIFKLRNTQDKKKYGNTPFLKQLIDYFYDCISKDNTGPDRVNVHEGLYIEL